MQSILHELCFPAYTLLILIRMQLSRKKDKKKHMILSVFFKNLCISFGIKVSTNTTKYKIKVIRKTYINRWPSDECKTSWTAWISVLRQSNVNNSLFCDVTEGITNGFLTKECQKSSGRIRGELKICEIDNIIFQTLRFESLIRTPHFW